PAGGLVEDEQWRAGHQGGDEDDLLPVPLGVGADLLGRIEVEPVDQLVPVAGVDGPVHAAEQMQGLGAGEGGPQACLPRYEREAPVRLGRPALAVRAEDL